MNYTRHRTRTLGATIALLALVFSGCAAKINTVTLPQTALQKTIVFNYATSEANLAVGRTVRDLQAAGAITVPQATPIITGTVKIATMSDSIRAITSQGTEAGWAVDGPKIRKIIADAQVKLPPSTNTTVDLLIQTANAALLLLTQGAN